MRYIHLALGGNCRVGRALRAPPRRPGGARFTRPTLQLLALALLTAACQAADAPPAKTYGWRGNWTGLYPDANPPAQWGRIPNGVMAGMTCQAAKPADGAGPSGRPVEKGLVREWLLIGPFDVANSAKGLAAEQISGEAELAPQAGDKAGALAWQHAEIEKKPNYEVWGTTELDWLNPGEILGFKPNVTAYAFTYLYAPRAGKVVMVVDHSHGLKVRLNGTVVYDNPDRGGALGNYVGISRQKQELVHNKSPKFELPLQQGWNRLLLKLSSPPPNTWRKTQFAARLYDPDPAAYQEKNIAWMTRLPERTNACPIVVGDRIFTPAEPDELLCLDKATGKILWRRVNTLYEATPEADRAASPIFKEKIEPLVAELPKTADYEKGLELRRKINELLLAADKKRFRLKWDGHFAAHFGIIGFTTTPVSDGKYVYAFFGYGVVACYDLDGNRRWIRRLDAKEVGYTCSPALAGGKLLCVFGGLHALDAATGHESWANPEAGCTASLIPMRVGSTDAITLQGAAAYRSPDGKVLWTNPDKVAGAWAPRSSSIRCFTGWAASATCEQSTSRAAKGTHGSRSSAATRSRRCTTGPTASGSTAPAPPRRWSGRGSPISSTSTAPCTAPTCKRARRSIGGNAASTSCTATTTSASRPARRSSAGTSP